MHQSSCLRAASFSPFKHIFTSALGPPSEHYPSITWHRSMPTPSPPFYINISCSIEELATPESLWKNAASPAPQQCCHLPFPVLVFMHRQTLLYIKFPQHWLLTDSPIIYQMSNFMEQVIRTLLSWWSYQVAQFRFHMFLINSFPYQLVFGCCNSFANMIKNSVKINLHFSLNYLQTKSPTAMRMVINPSKKKSLEMEKTNMSKR